MPLIAKTNNSKLLSAPSLPRYQESFRVFSLIGREAKYRANFLIGIKGRNNHLLSFACPL
jgi:hypothetical protein